jgi:hypothetical protein
MGGREVGWKGWLKSQITNGNDIIELVVSLQLKPMSACSLHALPIDSFNHYTIIGTSITSHGSGEHSMCQGRERK